MLLAGLPLAVWLDVSELSEIALRHQAADFNASMNAIRGYYATNVVGRVLAHPGSTQVVHNYESIPGAIPIPATMSLELGPAIEQEQRNIAYRFVSDFPFNGRAAHAMDEFEKTSLQTLRTDPNRQPTDVSWSGLTNRVRLITPVMMGAVCIECHNSHPDSPKRDGKIGDVGGIQEISVTQPIGVNIFSFKYLMLYFFATSIVGGAFIRAQRRQAAAVTAMNRELEQTNEFLGAVSTKISRYLAPQVYKSIFRGQKDVVIETERKKLSIFFSDIKDFTATTERLQPEEITALLNEYLTEMSAIALQHGGTVNRFVGDAILIFFGDPDTKGVKEDAQACFRMAINMRERVAELSAKWRSRGIEHPFRVRMGINTGFCNVGNFGSTDRMDYTIIGAEANLAARLQSVAEAGEIVISYETYALVRDIVSAHALAPITMKGIGYEVVPYAVDGLLGQPGEQAEVVCEQARGVDIYLDPRMVDSEAADRVRAALRRALTALDCSATADHRDLERSGRSAW